ncbi:hypothetical protein ASC82_20695 [Streptomyces sp. Root431]|uniref:hypothetical protein n=1 Tax=Streptomyces sp. Root431 TaxID=1736535 RepID=UPI0006F3DC73|nr:hypothetical protein [Streptomyces sp. Root431]KQX11294.1 hypothetical protein ASC82_20695 [Streptomyces sp. Root431]
MTKRVLLTAVGALLALAGLAAFLALQGLDEADKWSSVLSLFFTVAGFALALAGFVSRGPAQSADHAVTGGSLHQVRNVTGDVVITGGGGTASTPPTIPPADGESAGGTQSAHGARTAGDVHQIDGVDGSVRIEPPRPTP